MPWSRNGMFEKMSLAAKFSFLLIGWVLAKKKAFCHNIFSLLLILNCMDTGHYGGYNYSYKRRWDT